MGLGVQELPGALGGEDERNDAANGLLAAQVFLYANGITLDCDSEAFYDLTMGEAEGASTSLP